MSPSPTSGGESDDGCGICGKTMTKTVTVQEHEDAPRCICPKITISTLLGKTGSTERGFTASLTGPERAGLAFNWNVSEGTILSGQGAREIKVEPSGDPRGRPVTVTVEVSGLDPNCECPTTATKDLRY